MTADGFDVIVVGIGAMGSAACHELARRGKKVLGLERHGIPHELGSSHGITRIIRLAYYESPDYVTLLRRAFELWADLEAVAGERLLIKTGSVDAGPEGNWVVEGSIESCEIHGLDHEVLDAAELNRRAPGYRLSDGLKVCFQPDGGFLLPERCIVANASAALAHGAELHGAETVLGWSVGSSGVTVETDRGSYQAERLVLAAGAWLDELVPGLAGTVVPERQVLGWFHTSQPEKFTPDSFPVFNLEVPEGRFYGFPQWGIPGFKIGRYHHRQEQGHPDELRAPPDAEDERLLREAVARYFPDANGPALSLRTCLFTNTPDEHFVIDSHPDHDAVIIASPCSGHGFKFASVVGEILAELVTDGATRHPISQFSLSRFS